MAPSLGALFSRCRDLRPAAILWVPPPGRRENGHLGYIADHYEPHQRRPLAVLETGFSCLLVPIRVGWDCLHT